TLAALIATTSVLGASTTPPTGRSTVIADVALPTLPLASRKRNTMVVVPTGHSVSAVASITAAFTLACGTSRTGAVSCRSTADPPARNARTRCEAADPRPFPRAPSTSAPPTEIATAAVTPEATRPPTTTRKTAPAEWPAASVRLHWTVVTPNGK